MSVTPNDLRKIPLFTDIPDADLKELFSRFSKVTFEKGQVLFKDGDMPDRLLLLTDGQVSLTEANAPKYLVNPFALIGELGSLTGIPRSSTATATRAVSVLAIKIAELSKFFEANASIGLPFYKKLLELVSDKVQRDRRRLADIRANVIRTQKAMKKLRDAVLAAPTTEISKPVCEMLDEHIEQNRRAHYRVVPNASLSAHVRLEDKSTVQILDLSDAYLKLDATKDRLAPKGDVVAVLVLPTKEILISGKVQRAGKDGVVVKLDLLVDEYQRSLEDYVTQLQLLDFVV